MKNAMKRVLAVMLATVMLVSAMSTMVYATSMAEEIDYIELVLGEEVTATISQKGGKAYFAFTPAEDGVYVFQSFAEKDTYGYLYDADMEELSSDDDGGDSGNFRIQYTLTAGETYYLGARYYSSKTTGSFPVKVSEINVYTAADVSEITVEPISVVEESIGYTTGDWDEELGEYVNTYFFYEWFHELDYTITMKDGVVLKGSDSGGFYDENDNWYQVNWDDGQSTQNPWLVNHTYQPTVTILGHDITVSVTVEESPVESVDFHTIVLLENSDGYWRDAWDEEQQTYVEYFDYNWGEKLTGIITLKDGTQITCKDVEGGEFHNFYDEEGNRYRLHIKDNQSPNTPWTVDNTYYPTVSVMGYETTVPVKIVDTLVESVEVKPIQMIENYDGCWDSSWDDETEQYVDYYYYGWRDRLEYTITLKDGTTLQGYGGMGVEDENGNWYDIETEDDQSATHPWMAGNTYYPTITVMGYETTVSVEIVESPIANIEFEPIRIVENTNGYEDFDWDENDEMVYYYHYQWYDKLSYTITMKDGTELKGTGYTFEDTEGNWYYVDWHAPQGPDNPWTVGNTYHPTITVMGYETTVSVEIVESPVVSVEVEPIRLIENTNGYENYDWDENDEMVYYYHYEWYYKLSYTITMKDGTELKGIGTTFEDDEGNWYYVDWHALQDAENPWTMGNTYYPSVNILGFETTVPVEIIESPLVSVEFEPITITENTDGYWDNYYVEETKEYFYYYEWYQKLSYTVTLKNGTVLSGNGTSFYDENGDEHTITYTDDQWPTESWEAGCIYSPTVSIMGYKTTVSVEIVDSCSGGHHVYDNDCDYACNECGRTRIPATIDTAGAQLREDGDSQTAYDLRFGFHLTTESIGYADPSHADDNYQREELDESTTGIVDGQEVQIVEFGTILTLKDGVSETDLTLENCAEDGVWFKNVPAVNLYDVSDGYITYTAVVKDIPETAVDMAIHARPYIQYLDGDTVKTIYGDAFTACVSDYF